MGVKISELPVASALTGTEAVPVVQDGETRKATVADIAPVQSVAGRTGAVTLTAADIADLSAGSGAPSSTLLTAAYFGGF